MGYSQALFLDENIADEFICTICHDVIMDATMTHPCEHVFCKACIEQWRDGSDIAEPHNCPTDRARIKKLKAPPRVYINLLNRQQLHCEFNELGCFVILTLGEYEFHKGRCEFNPENNEECGNGCGAILRANQIIGHNCIAYLKEQIELQRTEKDLINRQLQSKNEELLVEKERLRVEKVEHDRCKQRLAEFVRDGEGAGGGGGAAAAVVATDIGVRDPRPQASTAPAAAIASSSSVGTSLGTPTTTTHTTSSAAAAAATDHYTEQIVQIARQRYQRLNPTAPPMSVDTIQRHLQRVAELLSSRQGRVPRIRLTDAEYGAAVEAQRQMLGMNSSGPSTTSSTTPTTTMMGAVGGQGLALAGSVVPGLPGVDDADNYPASPPSSMIAEPSASPPSSSSSVAAALMRSGRRDLRGGAIAGPSRVRLGPQPLSRRIQCSGMRGISETTRLDMVKIFAHEVNRYYTSGNPNFWKSLSGETRTGVKQRIVEALNRRHGTGWEISEMFSGRARYQSSSFAQFMQMTLDGLTFGIWNSNSNNNNNADADDNTSGNES